jgi:activator of 2-hydroxyglutaryl-CoA dehydratase
VIRPEHPQLAGAMGAAIYAMDRKEEAAPLNAEEELP